MIHTPEMKEIDDLEKQIGLTQDCLSEKLKGKDVLILGGKYKGRKAQIQYYYFHRPGGHCFHVRIYRKPGTGQGFKGEEQFISDHNEEYIGAWKCSFNLDAKIEPDRKLVL